MKIDHFCKALGSLEALLSASDCGAMERAIGQLRSVLAPHGNMTMAAFLKRAEKTTSSGSRLFGGKAVGEVKQVLTTASDFMGCLRSKAGKEAFMKVANIFIGHEQEVFSDYLEKLKAALDEKRTSSVVKKGTAARANLIAAYIEKLNAAMFDTSSFNQIVAEMKKNRSLRVKQEWTEIANRIYGVNISYKKKQDAVDLIQLKQQQEQSGKYNADTKVAI